MDQSINVSSFENPPYLMPCFQLPQSISLNSIEPATYCRSPGFAIELVVALLSNAGSFKNNYTQINFQKSNGYGDRLPDGQWTGMVGDLVNNRSHITLPSVAVTQDRLEVVDFDEQPFYFIELCFVLNPSYTPKISVDSCFDRWSWVALMMTYVCLLGVLLLKRLLGKLSAQVCDAIYDISFRQDVQNSSDPSGAILTIMWSQLVSRMLFVVFASSLYYQTQKPLHVPHQFSDIPHFLTFYQLFQRMDTVFYDDLVGSVDERFVQIRKSLRPHNFFPFEGKSISAIIIGGKNRMSYVPCATAKVVAGQNPGLLVSPQADAAPLPLFTGMNKHLPASFKRYLSMKSNRFREYGIVERLSKKYFGHTTGIKKSRYAFTIATFSNSFLLYLSLMGGCFATLLIERILHQ